MRRMGGLKDKLPVTYWTMVVGSLALAGFPLTAGYFSKDEILVNAWSAGGLGQILAVVGLVTAFLTAFYSFRLLFVAFHGESRVDPHHANHIHEPSPTMTVPLVILAILSIATGYLGIPSFLSPVLPSPGGSGVPHGGPAANVIMLFASVMGIAGIVAAYVVYVRSPMMPQRLAEKWKQAYALSFNKWYVDELYDRTIVKPTVDLANGLWRKVDVAVIDALVNGVASATVLWARGMRLVQSGEVQHYALAMALGAVVILGFYLLMQ
jgi:NADH-quinone oxidoreductase subunit L